MLHSLGEETARVPGIYGTMAPRYDGIIAVAVRLVRHPEKAVHGAGLVVQELTRLKCGTVLRLAAEKPPALGACR